jgi:hypothetical protein
MRCREHRRADLHSLPNRRPKGTIWSSTKTPRPVTTAIVQGITGGTTTNYQILPRVQPPSIPLSSERHSLTKTLSAGPACTGQISQDLNCKIMDRPWGSHDRNANAASLSDWASSSSRYYSTSLKLNGKPETKFHGHDDAEHSLPSTAARLVEKATRLYAQAPPALDRPISIPTTCLILDLPTNSLEAWIWLNRSSPPLHLRRE